MSASTRFLTIIANARHIDRDTAARPDALFYHPRDHVVFRGEDAACLSPQEADLFVILFADAHRVVDFDDIIQQLWGDRVDGGPLTANKQIGVVAGHLRTKIRHLGLDVRSSGYSRLSAVFIGHDAATPAVRSSPFATRQKPNPFSYTAKRECWTPLRKRFVVDIVARGVITQAQAATTYGVSGAEIDQWRREYRTAGHRSSPVRVPPMRCHGLGSRVPV